MENEENQVQSTTTQDDAILPDGWDGTTDLFEWASGETKADEPIVEAAAPEESGTEESEETPTTGTETEENVESGADEGEAPATETKPEEQSTKIRFDANINHKVKSIEIDQSELPEIYQKAYASDKYRSKLNARTAEMEQAEVVSKLLGYGSVKEMLDAAEKSFEDTEVEKLVNENVHPTIAKDTVARKIKEIKADTAKNRKTSQPETKEETKEDSTLTKAGDRDFRPEVADLVEAYPELHGKTIPEEVVDAALKGQTLMVAYTKYLQQKTKADNDRLQKENKTLRQNAEAAKRAPVRGVAKGGATGETADDPFLKGFNMYS